MGPDEFKSMTSEILSNLSDQGKVSEYLSQLTEHYTTAHTTNQTLQEQQTEHQKEIEALKETNMNLFLKIQGPATEPTSDPTTTSTQKESLTYEKLLNDLGGIK